MGLCPDMFLKPEWGWKGHVRWLWGGGDFHHPSLIVNFTSADCVHSTLANICKHHHMLNPEVGLRTKDKQQILPAMATLWQLESVIGLSSVPLSRGTSWTCACGVTFSPFFICPHVPSVSSTRISTLMQCDLWAKHFNNYMHYSLLDGWGAFLGNLHTTHKPGVPGCLRSSQQRQLYFQGTNLKGFVL